MIKKITIAAVLCASAAYFIYHDVIDVPGKAPARQAHASNEPAAPQPVAATRYEPEQRALDDDDTELVLGVRVRKNRNCRVELKDYVTTAGEMFSAYSCTPNKPTPPHLYADYNNKTLASMAYADADAAALLGKRLIGKNTRKSYQLLIRAAALDGGKIEHIAWLADQAFGAVAINGEPQIANLKQQYKLAALAVQLGDDPGKARYLKNKLIEIGFDEDQFSSLENRATALLQSMRDIQRTVLGEVTIVEPGEKGDA
jgi:hypothetical protein